MSVALTGSERAPRVSFDRFWDHARYPRPLVRIINVVKTIKLYWYDELALYNELTPAQLKQASPSGDRDTPCGPLLCS